MPSTSRNSSGPSLPAVALGLALGAWLLAAGAGVRAAPQPPDPKLGAFSESTEVTVVQVPVQVVRDGGPVQGLTAADFTVFHGRKHQNVTRLHVLDLSSQPG